jgi:hypothetical protein
MKDPKGTMGFDKLHWLLIFLVIISTLSIFVNIVLWKALLQAFSTQFYTTSLEDNTIERMAKFEDNTWLWRIDDSEDVEDQTFTSYSLNHMGTSGDETVLYQTNQDNIFGEFGWKFNDSGDSVVITDIDGAPEGAVYTHIAFKDNQEIFRSIYNTYGPYVQNFLFKTPDSSEYKIGIKTTETCRLNNNDTILKNIKTDLLGLVIANGDTQQAFLLDNPQTVSCATIDGDITNPAILARSIKADTDGIGVILPGGTTQAFIFVGDNGELDVSYY